MKTVLNFLKLNLVYLAAFFAARLVFFFVFRDAAYPFGEVARAFITGARLDLSLAALFTGWIYILACAAGQFSSAHKWIKRAVVAYLAVLNSVFLVLLVSEFPFYTQYSSRLNHLFFEYMSRPVELFITLSGIVSLVPVIIALFAGMYVIYLLSRKLAEKFFEFEPACLKTWVGCLVCIGLTVVFIRGGVQRRPINWGTAFFSRHNFINQTALNGIYNLQAHLQVYYEERGRNLQYRDYFSDGKALEIISAGFGEEKPLLSLPAGSKPNIVVIFMESFAAKYCGAVGAQKSLSPNFDALAKKGVLFTSFYANGTRTSRALTAGLCGYPPLPGVNLTKKVQAQQPMPSVADYLSKNGYSTMFFYGGDRDFEDMSAFFMKGGFEKFYDYKDFKNIRNPTPIGVYDEELFENVDKTLAAETKPFFAAVMTLTNHGPFTLPPDYKPADPSLPKELKTYQYSDMALGKFMAEAEKRPYFKNTVFIIMSDHSNYYTDFNSERFHIPLLIYSPLVRRPAVYGHIASQLGVPMEILRMCSIPLKHSQTGFWGSGLGPSLLGAYVLDDPYFGQKTAKYFYRESFSGGGYILEGENKTKPDNSADESQYPRAVLQLSRKLFFEGRAGKPWQSISLSNTTAKKPTENKRL